MNLRCAWYRRHIEKYADDLEGMPAGSSAARHVQQCAGCRAAWSALRHLAAELREALVVPAAPTPVETNAWTRASARPLRHSVRLGPAWVVGASGAVAVAALLALRPWGVGPKGPHRRTRAHPRVEAAAPPMMAGSRERRLAALRTHAGARYNPGSADLPVGGGPSSADLSVGGGGRNASPASDARHPAPTRALVTNYRQRPRLARLFFPGASDTIPDPQYLDGAGSSRLNWWGPVAASDQAQLESVLRQLPPPADDFVRVPLPLIASADESKGAVAAAAREYERRAKVIDARLYRKVTLQAKGMALVDVCARMQEQTGVELRASRVVADEKVTVFVKDERARDVMRAIARLFGYLWSRSGEEGAYRYELDQDMRSQLLEEELRNRDQNAALLALDAEMQKYRPFLDLPYDELKKRWDQLGEVEKQQIWQKPDNSGKRQLSTLVEGNGWGGVLLCFRLTPRDRTALLAGQMLVFRPDAPDAEHRLPAELCRPALQSLGEWTINGHRMPLADVPAARLRELRLILNRSESGKLTLLSTTSMEYQETSTDNAHSAQGLTFPKRELATGQSRSVALPENAVANAALRGQSTFDRPVALHPDPSCPAVKGFRFTDLNPNLDMGTFDLDRSQPYLLSADVWEAVHQATGRPIVADFYTRLYPPGKVTVQHEPLFDALCRAGDALGVRWRQDGDFLLCRSTSYYWDKLKEVPNRYLQRWAQDRDTNGGLPLNDFLEMAAISDQQLDSESMAQGVEHLWGLPEWAWLGRRLSTFLRPNARMLGLLAPEQLRRALEPGGLPLKTLGPTQQQRLMQLLFEKHEIEEREWGASEPLRPEQFADTAMRAIYIPAGWYLAYETTPFNPCYIYGGRTPGEAKAAQRQYWRRSETQEVRRARAGYFMCDFETVVGSR